MTDLYRNLAAELMPRRRRRTVQACWYQEGGGWIHERDFPPRPFADFEGLKYDLARLLTSYPSVGFYDSLTGSYYPAMVIMVKEPGKPPRPVFAPDFQPDMQADETGQF